MYVTLGERVGCSGGPSEPATPSHVPPLPDMAHCNKALSHALFQIVKFVPFSPKARYKTKQKQKPALQLFAVPAAKHTRKLLLNLQHGLNLLQGQGLALAVGQRFGRAYAILDLAAVVVALGKGVQASVVDVNVLDACKEVFPHRLAGGLVEVAVLQGDVDAALESLVEGVDAVGGEDQDALVVFEQAQEDGHEGVAAEVLRAALLQEDVGLVEQQDGLPDGGHVEDLRELFLEVVVSCAQLAGRDHVQWPSGDMADCLGGPVNGVLWVGLGGAYVCTSAVSVLPTPGGPWSTAIKPRPLPLIKSSKSLVSLACASTSTRISDFCRSGSTNWSNTVSENRGADTMSTKN